MFDLIYLEVSMYVILLSLVLFRMIKHHFTKYNRENIGLIILSAIMALVADLPGTGQIILLSLSAAILIVYLSLFYRTRTK